MVAKLGRPSCVPLHHATCISQRNVFDVDTHLYSISDIRRCSNFKTTYFEDYKSVIPPRTTYICYFMTEWIFVTFISVPPVFLQRFPQLFTKWPFLVAVLPFQQYVCRNEPFPDAVNTGKICSRLFFHPSAMLQNCVVARSSSLSIIFIDNSW